MVDNEFIKGKIVASGKGKNRDLIDAMVGGVMYYNAKDKEYTTVLKSSGKTREFSSGAMRDSADGKPRMELIPDDLMMRVATWYGLGAEKYGSNNWRKGQPVDACVGSLKRHLAKYLMGQRDEDHLSAIVFNALSIMNVEMYHADDPQLNNMNYQEQVKGDE